MGALKTAAYLIRSLVRDNSFILSKTSLVDQNRNRLIKTLNQFTWDGTAPLKKDGENLVFGSVSLRKKTVIPKGCVLTVAPGSVLIIEKDAVLCCNGELWISSCASVRVEGKLLIQSDAKVSLYGRLQLPSQGRAVCLGSLKTSGDSEIVGEGKLAFDTFEKAMIRGTCTVPFIVEKSKGRHGETYLGGLILVNRKNPLPREFGGENDTAKKAFLKLKEAANNEGHQMELLSNYRSFERQQKVYLDWCNQYGEDEARLFSAPPGFSEHQTGLAFDVTSLEEEYGETPEGKWLASNAHRFGFIIRYPKNKTYITGYRYEPWHIRYVGKTAANLLYQNDLCLEELESVETKNRK